MISLSPLGPRGCSWYDFGSGQAPSFDRDFSDYIVGKGIDLTAKSTLFVDEELDLEELTLDTLKSFDRLGSFWDGP